MVTEAVRRELESFGEVLAGSTLAASALVLAGRLDAEGTADTAVPALARELREALVMLRAEAAGDVADRMTEFEQRRQRRAASG